VIKKTFFLFCALLPFFTYATENDEVKNSFCYFVPPKGWREAKPDQLSSHVRVGFVGKGKSSFSPSLNLALEEVAISAEKYVEVVKKLHQADKKNAWRDLGKIQTRSGEAHLTAIDTKTEFGPVRLMQMILVKDGMAYVLTGAALKDEFSPLYKEFQGAFQSLTITNSEVTNENEKDNTTSPTLSMPIAPRNAS
jgi:hypothetical protein